MSNLEKAQRKMKSLATWLDGRDHYTDSLTIPLDSAQRKIARMTNEAIDDTIQNMERFIERANLDSQDDKICARYRQMTRTDLKRLLKAKKELEELKQ